MTGPLVPVPRLLILLRAAHDADLTVEGVLSLERDGPTGVHRVLAGAGHTIGRALTDLADSLDPGLVVVGCSLVGARRRNACRPPEHMGAPRTHAGVLTDMAKVMQIRGVPDDVHSALTAAARAEGLSLTRYVQRELRHLAERAQVVRHNTEVVRRTQGQVRGHVDPDAVLAVLHAGRRG